MIMNSYLIISIYKKASLLFSLICICVFMTIQIYIYSRLTVCRLNKKDFVETSRQILNSTLTITKRGKISLSKPFIMFPSLCSPINACFMNKRLIILIKSAAYHITKRNIIRKTYARTVFSNDIYVYFVVGVDPDFGEHIGDECLTYNDVIQGSFIDTYRNNTLKTVFTYRWTHLHCSHVPFVFLIDDDYIVNLSNVFKFIESTIKSGNVRHMYGSLTTGWKPVRNSDDHKAFVSKNDFPYDCYPDYLAGGATLTSIRVIKEISLIFAHFNMFPVDDAYIGFLTYILNIAKTNENKMTASYVSHKLFNEYICFQTRDEASFVLAWRTLNS